MPVKKDGPGLHKPVTSADKKYLRSWRTSTELIQSVAGEGKFSTADHLLALREKRRDVQKIRGDSNNANLKGLVEYLKASGRRLILRAKKHRFLAEHMGYYGNRYSTRGYWKIMILLHGMKGRQLRIINNMLNQFKFVDMAHSKLAAVTNKSNLLLVEAFQQWQRLWCWKSRIIDLKMMVGVFQRGISHQWQLLQRWKINNER